MKKPNECESEVLFEIFWCHYWLFFISVHINLTHLHSACLSDWQPRRMQGRSEPDWLYLPSESQALVSESHVILQNFCFSANSYLTLLPLSKHSLHKDTISSIIVLLPLHGCQCTCSLAQVACNVCHSLLHSAPSSFFPAQTLQQIRGTLKKDAPTSLQFAQPQLTISFSRVSRRAFHSCPLWQRILHSLEITAEIVAHLQAAARDLNSIRSLLDKSICPLWTRGKL